MRIPPTLKIAGITYEVCYNNGSIKTEDEDGKMIEIDTVANVNFIDCTINLSTDLNEQVMDLSFMHEVVHAILFAMGYQANHSKMENDEVFVEGFGQLMLQVVNQIVEYNVWYEDYQMAMKEDMMPEDGEVIEQAHWYLKGD